MHEQATSDTTNAEVEYRRADLEDLEIDADSVDLAYSSLTLHYVADLARLTRTIHDALTPGGRFVFSVEHPMVTAPSRPRFIEVDDATVWPVDQYALEGERSTVWFANGVIKHHRTIGAYLNTLIKAGFQIAHVEEWSPNDHQVAEHPEWANERQRPPFLLVACAKDSVGA
jgi:SAM-dependent methyltransferase